MGSPKKDLDQRIPLGYTFLLMTNDERRTNVHFIRPPQKGQKGKKAMNQQNYDYQSNIFKPSPQNVPILMMSFMIFIILSLLSTSTAYSHSRFSTRSSQVNNLADVFKIYQLDKSYAQAAYLGFLESSLLNGAYCEEQGDPQRDPILKEACMEFYHSQRRELALDTWGQHFIRNNDLQIGTSRMVFSQVTALGGGQLGIYCQVVIAWQSVGVPLKFYLYCD